MKAWKICLFYTFLLLSSTLGEDTVAEDLSVHQLERLVELLTSTECKDLLRVLSEPEDDIFQHLERLSLEKNELDSKPKAKRDTSSTVDALKKYMKMPLQVAAEERSTSSKEYSETECQKALTDWLLKNGEKTYYERLSRSLQRIGRTDIAIEVGKSINQDKMLDLKRYVEDYHKYVSSLELGNSETKGRQDAHRRVKKRKVGDLKWHDLELIVKRAPLPLYQKGPLDVALPLLYGFLVGFGGILLGGMFFLLLILQ